MKEQHSFVITGASSFLGMAFSKMLSKNKNYKVLITSRTKVNFEEILDDDRVFYLPEIDLTNDADIKKLVKVVDKFLPNKFHVINCLGYFPGYHTIEETDTTVAKKVFDGNVIALYAVAHNLIPLMSYRKGGHFIGFSTHTLYQDYPKMVAFSAAKAAVESLIKGIANEYFEKGINANTIALATLLTEIELKMKPQGDFQNWLQTHEVCEFVESIILQPNQLLSGNVIHVYKHSDSYFKQSYFHRIKS